MSDKKYPSNLYLESAATNVDFARQVSVEAVVVMAKELLALRKAFSEPVAFYASGAYYNTAKAALKDGAEDVMPLFTHPYRSE